ncbi:MAG: ATP-dependent helicase, partial [Treponema sp.]|nr:ATP-dependent helicase [Treponema sp.]
ANPHDDVSLLRVINTPRRGIGRTTVAALSDIARRNGSCIWDAVSNLNNARQNGQSQLFQDSRSMTELEEFRHLIETQRAELLGQNNEAGQAWSLSQKTKNLVDAVDYWSYLVAEHGKEEKKARWKYSNIEYFVRMMENWEKDSDNTDRGLYSWLNRISLITKDDGETDALGKVSLMTIHSAKGLEFPVVFIAGAEEGLIPHEKSVNAENGDEAGSLEEERRLFYVAITRAKDKLFITCCRERRHLRGDDECKPSPFLEEIPKHLVQPSRPASAEEEKALSDELLEKLKERVKGGK